MLFASISSDSMRARMPLAAVMDSGSMEFELCGDCTLGTNPEIPKKVGDKRKECDFRRHDFDDPVQSTKSRRRANRRNSLNPLIFQRAARGIANAFVGPVDLQLFHRGSFRTGANCRTR